MAMMTENMNDGATGLYFYRARYYSPEMGRFISEDPIGLLGGVNYFAYVGNSPCNFTDPLGLERILISLGKDRLTLYDDNDKMLFEADIVHGCKETPTSTGEFVLGDWIVDLTSEKWGWKSETPWSESWWGGNVFGPYYMPILGAGNIGIHGTIGPSWSPWKKMLFECGSHGCIRLTNRDIIKLHELLPSPQGTAVKIMQE